ncbi:MAG: YjjG family noncanonical pyrimidine nucleotidase [Flavobacteriaceae bacterium]|nr:YjjG family noncanonical pyrimidine nucleotidase [Flavobacteriaceae bacterium]
MNIEHVFFDLDHTLWDFERNSALTFKKIFSEYNVKVNFKGFMTAYIPINANYWKLYREDKISKEDLRYYRLKKTFDAINFEIEDDKIDFFSEEYIHQLPNFNHLFEGTLEILEYLKKKYELHIITNGFEEVQALKMEKSGILGFFNQVITSESVGVKKPNPKIFEYALKKANTKAENSIMIGDNLEADIQGAIDSGIHVLHYNSENTNNIPENITSVVHLLEIKQYL